MLPDPTRNLLDETIAVLKENGKTPEDVRWVGGEFEKWAERQTDYGVGTWEQFASLANKTYDSGFGGQGVSEFFVVGDDWWMERHEYDGSEWWEFKTLPSPPENTVPLSNDHIWRD